MPPYSELQAADDYVSKVAGAGVEIIILEEGNPGESLIGATSGIQWTDNFEQLGVEEAGNDGVDEHVTGRHDGSCTIPAFFTPQWNDRLPTRQDFLGKTYTVLEKIAKGRPQEGQVLNALTGVKINRVGGSQGARGLKTMDLGLVYKRRYNGKEYATLTGNA